jgi:ribosomal protein S18 acetylase RimI-like enzyme
MSGLTANSNGWRDDLRRSVETARSQGIKSFVLKALARIVYRHVVLFRLDIDGTMEMVPAGVELEVARLREQDIPAYAAFRGCSEDEARARFDRGHFAFVTWTEGRISSVVWMQEGEVWIPDVDAHLPLDDGELYAYDTWTAPELRHHRIAGRRARIVSNHLAGEGYTGFAAFVLPENKPALAFVESLGMRRAGYMAYFQLGPLRIDVIKREHRRPRIGLRRSPRPLRRSPLAVSANRA